MEWYDGDFGGTMVLTKRQQAYWDALIAAGARDKVINACDVELRLKRAGCEAKSRDALYKGLRRIARKEPQLVITTGADGGYHILPEARGLRRVK